MEVGVELMKLVLDRLCEQAVERGKLRAEIDLNFGEVEDLKRERDQIKAALGDYARQGLVAGVRDMADKLFKLQGKELEALFKKPED